MWPCLRHVLEEAPQLETAQLHRDVNVEGLEVLAQVVGPDLQRKAGFFNFSINQLNFSLESQIMGKKYATLQMSPRLRMFYMDVL